MKQLRLIALLILWCFAVALGATTSVAAPSGSPFIPSAQEVVTLRTVDFANAKTDVEAMQLLAKHACFRLPSARSGTEAEYQDKTKWNVVAQGGRRVPALLRVDYANHRVCIRFFDATGAAPADPALAPVFSELFADLQRENSTAIFLEYVPDPAQPPSYPVRVQVVREILYKDAYIANSGTTSITGFDINRPIGEWASWLCIVPEGDAPAKIVMPAKDLAVSDVRGRNLITFGGDTIVLEKKSLKSNKDGYSDWWCVPLDGAQVSIANEGLATDEVRVVYQGAALSKGRISPRYANARTFAKPYIVVGTELALCNKCQRSFVPASVTTVRAVVPVFQLAGGYPKVFEARLDVGLSPGFLTGSDAASSIVGVALAPIGGACLAIDSGSAPRLCGFAMADVIAVSTRTDQDTSAKLKLGVQPSGMAVVGLSLP